MKPCHCQAKIMVVKDIEREDIEFISKILGVEAGNPAWISIQDPVGDVSEKKDGASYLPKLVYYCMLRRVYSNVSKTMSCLPPMTGNGNHTTYTNGD
jgi:hypothetical protein